MALYEKLEYELELITPAFIGGAFPKERAELRPASFIGILRWWFRNLALTFTDDLNEIYNLESKLFGNTKKAGKVWVRFGDIPKEEYKQFEVPQNVDIGILAYLGYGNFRGTKIVKAFLPSRTKVKLTILVPKKYKNLLENLLFIVSQLGALGGRNRRGWGNFYLNSLNGKKESWKSCKVERAYENFISELCKFIPRGDSVQIIRIYEIYYEEQNPLGVLDKIGKDYRGFRERYDCNRSKVNNHLQRKQECDYTQVKKFLQRKHQHSTVIYNRAWFGLPIRARYKSLSGKSATINVFQKNLQERRERRLASPVIFRVFRNSDGKFGVLFIVFYHSEFYQKRGKFYKWFLGGEREVRVTAKGLKPKPVVMNQSFEKFVCNFLQEIKVSTQPVLTLGG